MIECIYMKRHIENKGAQQDTIQKIWISLLGKNTIILKLSTQRDIVLI